MKFKKVYIELSNICNLNCGFCSNSNRKKRNLTIDEFNHIIKEIKPYTSYVYLHVKGEPLLYPDLDSILSTCDNNSIKVNITTNGTLIYKNKSILQKHKCIRQINVSLHSENKTINYFDDVFRTTNELSNRIIINYRYWLLKNFKDNKQSTDIVGKIINYFDVSTKSVDIIKQNNYKIKDNIFLNKNNEFIWPDLNNKYYSETGTCLGLKTHIAVLSDGKVVPCCLDGEGIINLGNIFNESLNDILKKDKTKNIKQGFNNNKKIEQLCQHCNFR